MKYSNLLLFMAAAAMTHAGTLGAQTANWVEMGSPSARCCMGMAYDPATRSTLLFGGVGPIPDQTVYGDTWIWQGGWFRLSPATSPSPRNGAGMAFDGAAGNIVFFGGIGSTGTYLNDTWTWDGTNWTQQFPPVSPPARNQMGMVYDTATQTVVLFGGNSAGGGVLGDTWTWDGVAKTWTQHNPVASPSARTAPMAYDAAAKTVVLFGGGNGIGTVQFTDTWTWDGTNWVQQFPASAPPARTLASMTYDANLGAAVLFGGYAGSWEDSLNDTWTWNGTNWTEIYPATVPPNRYSFSMNYDPINKAILMFGGYSSGPARGDTWLLALAP
jgi:hypothetical protein